MMAYTAQYFRYPNHIPYSTVDRSVTVRKDDSYNIDHHHLSVSTDNIETQLNNSNLSNNNNSNVNYNYVLSNGDIHNISSVSQNDTKLLKVTTVYNKDDDAHSAHASTITSNTSTAPPTFHLVRKSSVHAPRVELPTIDQLKVDIYSVGVIMESKMAGQFDPEKFKVEAVAPSGRVIRINGDGQYAAQFTPDEIGRWKVSMYYDNRFLDGCPIDVCDPSQVKIRDLQGGHVGKPNTFHVDCTRAGPGDLGVDVTHNKRAIHTHISPTTTPNYYKVTFTPYSSGPYEVNVHFNRAEVREGDIEFIDPEERNRKAVFYTRVEPREDHIEVKASCDWEVDYVTGRPFICHVTDSTDIAVYGMEDGTVCAHPQLIADCTRVGEGRLDAEVTHNGIRYPCKIRRESPCVYRISFKPKGPGIYKVWINYDGQPVKGSPFIQEIAELEKPTAHGDGLYRGVPGKPATFTIDPRGFPGQVSVGVNGPSRPVNSELEPQPNNTIKATYYPTERGPHTVNVRLDGRDIDGSPYRPLIVDPVSVRVSGGWRPYLDEKGLIPLRVNKEKHLPFDVSEAGPGELTSDVQGPNGKIPVTIDARNDGKHSVIFTPREEGKHYIHVNWGGYPLSNSPYLGYATHEPELDEPYPNVRLVQIPLQQHPDRSSQPPPGYVPVRSSYPPAVYTPDRYPSPRSSMVGSVIDGPQVSIRGSNPDVYRPTDAYYPPQQPTTIQVIPVNSPRSYPEPRRLDSPDNNNNASPKSPNNSQPTSPTGPQKVILSGKGLKEAEVDKPAHFYVDGTKANPGKPKSYLQGVRDQIPVKIDPVQPQVYKCQYVPQRPGAYLLYVNWNDKPLKGSPFKVNVREPARPHKVVTSEPKNPYVGGDIDMRIDPRDAGPGHLTVKCTDPKGMDVPCKLTDNYDGTRSLKMTPHIPGRHLVEIRYNGGHIMGSPYNIDIKENKEKGTVKVWGPGIENGIIPQFHSTFWVETTGAGAGDLRVRIVGPKGAFHVKMRKASQKDKIYQCFYDPVEPGIYTVHVQWSGVHVQGSPFTVLLATSARDLQRMQEDLGDTSNGLLNGSSAADDNSSEVMRRNRGRDSRNSRDSTPRDINSSNINDVLY